jgi:hypothetical protein
LVDEALQVNNKTRKMKKYAAAINKRNTPILRTTSALCKGGTTSSKKPENSDRSGDDKNYYACKGYNPTECFFHAT